MKKIKLPSVTIAVSVYNEEGNIKKFLASVLNQKEDGFKLNKIWIYSDGSIDRTVDKILEMNSKKIKVVNDSKRLGKSARLNQIYSALKTDYLLQTDADVIFSHEYVVRDMILPMVNSSRVGMCGGNPLPVPGKTFTEKAVNCTVDAYTPLRRIIKGGNNIFSVDGRILSYRKSLVKKIIVPENMIANDAYTYFCCLSQGLKYLHVPTAVVKFRSPQTINDQIRQNTRFTAAPARMARIFPVSLVRKEYYIPTNLKRKLIMEQFIRQPIMCTYIYLVNVYCKIRARIVEKKLNAKWSVALTTKSRISIKVVAAFIIGEGILPKL